MHVSILILMDIALKAFTPFQMPTQVMAVSILILMDIALKDCERG